MTRIVGGVARGRRLVVPAAGTRPTSERAREALFNTVRAQLDLSGAVVLDLYAGSGAVGLEALSRGAVSVDLVESDRTAAAAITRNVTTVGLPGARVHRRPVRSYLASTPTTPATFAFADPPYDLDEHELAGVLADLLAHLGTDAVVVVERSARGPEPGWPDGIDRVTQRRYGEACLWYGRRQS